MADTCKVLDDRTQALITVASQVEKSTEYQELESRLAALEKEKSDEDKRNVMKAIGYASSSVGLVTSIWGIYEKQLSLKNSMTELAIRENTHRVLTAELDILEGQMAMAHTADIEAAVLKKKQLLGEVEEKLANIKLRIRISRLGLYRGMFKGVTSIGIFTLTLFIDEFYEFFREYVVPKRYQAYVFFQEWDKTYALASFAGIAETLSPSEKAALVFASVSKLGMPQDVFDEELCRYGSYNPDGYRKIFTMGADTIKEEILKRVRSDLKRLKPFKLRYDYQIMEPDGTKVKLNAIH